ncbi:PH domain containing protein [Aphelenchoides avenae]|nr:PH domain containing protein [Aphelenchus avenae]
MSSDSPTQRVLQRVQERDKYLQSLSGSVNSAENTCENKASEEDQPAHAAEKLCESPKKPLSMTNTAAVGNDSSDNQGGPRRSRWSALAAHLDEFECDTPSPKPKEAFVKGPARRISHMPKVPASPVMPKAPASPVATNKDDGATKDGQKPTPATSSIVTPVATNKDDGATKDGQKSTPATNSIVTKVVTLESEPTSKTTLDTPEFSARAKTAETPASSYFTPKQSHTPVDVQTSTSVKALRSRWELSSSTGTPLQPDTSQDELLQAAVSLSEKTNKPAKRNFIAATRLAFSEGKSYQSPDLRRDLDVQSPCRKTARIFRPASESTTSEPSIGMVVEEDQIDSTGSECRSAETIDEDMKESVEEKPDESLEEDKDDDNDGSMPSPRKTIDEAFSFIKSPTVQATANEHSTDGGNDKEAGDETDAIKERTPPRNEPSLLDDITSDLEKYHTPHRPRISHVVDEDHQTRSPQLAHTISFYRQHATPRSVYHTPHTEPRGLFEHEEQVEETSTSMPGEEIDVKERIKRIEISIKVQQDQIAQASRALGLCRQTSMRGSPEEVESQKALLIATERRRMLIFERDRLTNQATPSPVSVLPRGTLTITTISVHLSRDFINKYIHRQQSLEGCLYYFIVLVKCGETVHHTNLASSDDGIKLGQVEFSHYIQLAGLSPDFSVTLEVYGLKTYRDLLESQSKKKNTWKKLMGTPSRAAVTSPSPIVSVDPSFQKIGSLVLNRGHVSRQKFTLTDAVYPLEGPVDIRMRVFAEKSLALSHRGFLSVYQVVDGYSSWTRFWCVLRDSVLNCWKWPEDEDKKSPALSLVLAQCVSPIKAVSNDLVSFQHAIDMHLAVITRGGETEHIKLMLAADTKAEMDIWTAKLNKEIENANLWK